MVKGDYARMRSSDFKHFPAVKIVNKLCLCLTFVKSTKNIEF